MDTQLINLAKNLLFWNSALPSILLFTNLEYCHNISEPNPTDQQLIRKMKSYLINLNILFMFNQNS